MPTLTKNQIEELRKNGLNDDEIQILASRKGFDIPKESLGKRIGRGIASVAKGVSEFVGAKGITKQFGADIARASVKPEEKGYVEYPSKKEVLGSAIQIGSLLIPGGLGVKAASKISGKGIVKGAARLGTKVVAGAGTGYGLDVGSKLQEGKSVGESLKPGIGTAVGATLPVAGAGIDLAKKGVPATLSFTSGVPKKAIEQAKISTEAAKLGRTSKSVEDIREISSQALKGLYKELSDDFSKGLDEVVSKTGQTKAGVVYNEKGFIKSGSKIRERLVHSTRNFAREFRISMKKTPEGMQVDFSKSPIVKGGEKVNVQEAINTISTWDDWSAKGMQDLAERVGALRKFESGVKTESSAILGKMYNRLTSAGDKGAKGIIGEFYPELAALRTKYAKSRKILDSIENVINSSKSDPKSIQTSISLLSNIFKQDKETYIKIIRELSKRSNVDILGMLAGTEFKEVLPRYIRNFGGGGAISVGVAGAGALLNPWLLLLSPLFSPRAVGKAIELGVKSASLRKAGAEITKKVAPLVGTKLNQ